MNTRPGTKDHHVIIIGGGFGGLYAAKVLGRAGVRVTLIDKRNFHLFQPLLYQVATGGLSPGDVAAPLRAVLKRHKNTRVLAATVESIDVEGRRVLLSDDRSLPFDDLIVATGMRYHYYGNDSWEHSTGSLKTVEDALDIRSKIFGAFEQAEAVEPAARAAWLRFVIVGAGPTGVELAGAIAELTNSTLRGEFRAFESNQAEIILLEGSDRVLPPYPQGLSRRARRSLQKLGVDVRTGARVQQIDAGKVIVEQEEQTSTIETHTVLWAAGMRVTPLCDELARAAGAEQDRQGRITVDDHLNLVGHEQIYVIGDIAHRQQDNIPLPGIAPVAMQQGRFVAGAIIQRLKGRSLRPFRYVDKGQMAVIGRHAAVVETGPLRFGGYLAWLTWLLVHIAYLIEFDNKLRVLAEWGWNYLTRKKGARLITRPGKGEEQLD
ncbi:MAG: NAD(P)/FAD-dependent oxidoreductase [Gemmatimonadetes bacterium]|nr:NAD(P)/FAD-dependent oxidoreductase [Gemmatimonadota bacterium]MBT4610341.1 NAD(P)/FAD-dependent oxidoreductase [Gemmatimonadota bacterium]MBT5060271.1 NAD(P)/FAD-dependent oxidoreductase [Gemmatimonadota bacterium]MBT5142627.1 NAD(P)/FAD-dependent oxidoreductase [Gemmatimonadota bacterium]MBT5587561.1 NAD(P)/FAD-dependent oxidoreductase [Gemmatimonadota bacterium]